MNEEPPSSDQKLLRKAAGARPYGDAIPQHRVEFIDLGRTWTRLIDSNQAARIEPSKLTEMDFFKQGQRENDVLLKIARDLTRYIYRHVLKFQQRPASPLSTLATGAQTPASPSNTD